MRISYGKDRCGNLPRSQNGNTHTPRPGPVRTGSQMSANGQNQQTPTAATTTGAANAAQSPAETDAVIQQTIAAAEARLLAAQTPPGGNAGKELQAAE
jgi:hypothetical protein